MLFLLKQGAKVKIKTFPSLTLHPLMIPDDTLRYNPADTTLPVWFRLDQYMYATAADTDSVSGNPGTDTLLPAGPPPGFFTARGRTTENEPELRKEPDKDWIYGSFALILVMIFILRLLYATQINGMLRSFLFPGKMGAEGRVFEFRMNLFSVLFTLIYSLTFGLLIFSVLEGYHLLPPLQPSDATLIFFAVSAAVALMFILKITMIRFAGALFYTREPAMMYNDHLLISAFTTTTLIIPLLVINTFSSSPVFLIITLGVAVILALVRIFRAFGVGFLVRGYSLFHFILYFCTLEMLPLLILGKGVLQLLLKR